MLCRTNESSHLVFFRVMVTRGFEGTSYSNWATSAYLGRPGHAIQNFLGQAISWSMSIFRMQLARKHETKQIACHPFHWTLYSTTYLLVTPTSCFSKTYNFRSPDAPPVDECCAPLSWMHFKVWQGNWVIEFLILFFSNESMRNSSQGLHI